MRSKKRIFGIASYNRIEYLSKAIDSIYDQADLIICTLNCDTPQMVQDALKWVYENMNRPKLEIYIAGNDLGDGAKFYKNDKVNGYFFTIDDDLIYPPNYADYMIENYERYGANKVMALHGRNFLKYPIRSFYFDKYDVFRVLDAVKTDTKVQFAGTCTTMWHTEIMQFNINEVILHPNMGDIWLTQEAVKRGIDIICLAHEKGFVQYLLPAEEETIYKQHKTDHKYQTEIANQIYAKV